MSFRGITFNKQTCKSEDDALIFHTFLNGCVGKVLGCSVTYDENNVYMGAGYFMTYGRFVNVVGTEILTPTPIEVGNQYNRLVFTIDLSKENTASEFKQGYFEFLTSYDAYPSLTREDLFNGGLVYQIPIAKFMLSVNGISSFVEEMGSVNISEVWTTLTEDLESYRDQYDEYFTEQKREFTDFFNTQEQTILQMIADLQDQNFVTNTVFDDTVKDIHEDIFNGIVTVDLEDSTGATLQTLDYTDLSATRKLKFI